MLTEVGVAAPSRATFGRCLRRIVEQDYRRVVSEACYTHAPRTGGLALVLYDALLRDPRARPGCARSA